MAYAVYYSGNKGPGKVKQGKKLRCKQTTTGKLDYVVNFKYTALKMIIAYITLIVIQHTPNY